MDCKDTDQVHLVSLTGTDRNRFSQAKSLGADVRRLRKTVERNIEATNGNREATGVLCDTVKKAGEELISRAAVVLAGTSIRVLGPSGAPNSGGFEPIRHSLLDCSVMDGLFGVPVMDAVTSTWKHTVSNRYRESYTGSHVGGLDSPLMQRSGTEAPRTSLLGGNSSVLEERASPVLEGSGEPAPAAVGSDGSGSGAAAASDVRSASSVATPPPAVANEGGAPVHQQHPGSAQTSLVPQQLQQHAAALHHHHAPQHVQEGSPDGSEQATAGQSGGGQADAQQGGNPTQTAVNADASRSAADDVRMPSPGSQPQAGKLGSEEIREQEEELPGAAPSDAIPAATTPDVMNILQELLAPPRTPQRSAEASQIPAATDAVAPRRPATSIMQTVFGVIADPASKPHARMSEAEALRSRLYVNWLSALHHMSLWHAYKPGQTKTNALIGLMKIKGRDEAPLGHMLTPCKNRPTPRMFKRNLHVEWNNSNMDSECFRQWVEELKEEWYWKKEKVVLHISENYLLGRDDDVETFQTFLDMLHTHNCKLVGLNCWYSAFSDELLSKLVAYCEQEQLRLDLQGSHNRFTVGGIRQLLSCRFPPLFLRLEGNWVDQVARQQLDAEVHLLNSKRKEEQQVKLHAFTFGKGRPVFFPEASDEVSEAQFADRCRFAIMLCAAWYLKGKSLWSREGIEQTIVEQDSTFSWQIDTLLKVQESIMDGSRSFGFACSELFGGPPY